MVKRKQAIKVLERNGWWLIRHGANHDIYSNGHATEPIPRHRDLSDLLWQRIKKRNNLE